MASVIDKWMNMEQWWNGTEREKPRNSEKYSHSATLSTSNLSLNGQALNSSSERLTAWALARPEACLNNIYKFSSHLTENTSHLCYKYELMWFMEIIPVYCENHTKETHIHWGKCRIAEGSGSTVRTPVTVLYKFKKNSSFMSSSFRLFVRKICGKETATS
jgi:hypothetical protein